MAKVFITGIAGFLGSHLADRMLAEGHEVVGCDNMIGGYQDNVPQDAEFHLQDCKYLNAMTKIMKDCDVLYHAACTPYEGLSVFSPHLVNENNFGITNTVVTAAVRNKVKRIVYCSSMARYGANKVPFTEDMMPKPQDPYGIGKVAGEDLIKCLSKVHNFEYVIAVPHNIIGPRQKYDDPFRNVASIMINLMLQGKQPVIYGDGKQMRCFSFVNDVVDGLESLAFKDNVLGETINVGPDEEPITILQLAETIAGLLDFDLKPRYFPDRPLEVKLATCSSEKARKLLGYNTKYTLKQGLSEMIDYIKTRGPRKFQYHLDVEILNDKTPKTWSEKVF